MARLPYLDAAALPEAERDLLVRPINLYRAMVNSPGITRAFLGLANTIRHASVLDARLREIAILAVAWETRSEYEWSHHLRIGRDFGVTPADLHAIAGGDPATLAPDAAAVLRAARAIVRDGNLADDLMAELRGHLDTAALTELLLVGSIYVGLARFLAVAGIETEPDYATELVAFPLPKP